LDVWGLNLIGYKGIKVSALQRHMNWFYSTELDLEFVSVTLRII
jgi:hypothetical protein